MPLSPVESLLCLGQRPVEFCTHARTQHIQFFATLWTAAHQAPLSMGFPRQEYWDGLLFPTPEDLPDAGIEPVSPVSPSLAGGFLTNCATWEAHRVMLMILI